MGIIFFGSKQTSIGIDEFMIKCPCCEAHSWADIMVLSKYFHIYWVPMFPFEKDVNIICQKCGLKRYDVPFESSIMNNYNEVKGKFRHPWFTYIGVGTLTLIFVLISLAAIL